MSRDVTCFYFFIYILLKHGEKPEGGFGAFGRRCQHRAKWIKK